MLSNLESVVVVLEVALLGPLLPRESVGVREDYNNKSLHK